MSHPEKVIENEILRYLAMEGLVCFKVKTVGTYDVKKGLFRRPSKLYMKGVADIIGALPDGRLLAIEVKSKAGKLNAHQKIFLERMVQTNAVAFVARSVEDVRKVLRGEINRPSALSAPSLHPASSEIEPGSTV